MPRVVLDGNLDHLVTPKHSDARGPVVRGTSIEVMKMHWRAGDSARPHQHPEEQAIYVISGRMRMTCGGETYDSVPAVSYHLNVLHSAMAVGTRWPSAQERGSAIPRIPPHSDGCATLLNLLA
jgi:quercetin dioxygenase-like cupin family protein